MKLWSFLINPFLVATKDSYRTAKKLGDFTVSALATQTSSPFIEMLDMLLPASESYNAAYMAWTSQRGMQKGNTSNLNAQLKILQSQKIEDWDIAIQQVYKQNTPQYISLLPNRRSPFQ